MCSGKNGLGGKPVTSTAPRLRVLWIGTGDSVRTDPVIIVGLTGRWIKGNGRSSYWVRSVSEMVWSILWGMTRRLHRRVDPSGQLSHDAVLDRGARFCKAAVTQVMYSSLGLQLLRRFPQFNVRGSGRHVRLVITPAKINSTLANCKRRQRWQGEEEGEKGTAWSGFRFSTFHRIPIFSTDEEVISLFQ